MVFDDWSITGKLGGDTLFGRNPFHPESDSMFSDYGLGGGFTAFDQPRGAFDPISTAFGDAFGLSGVDTSVSNDFLIPDSPVPTDAAPTPLGHGSSFASNYSVRMLVDMTGGQSSSFSRLGWL